MSLFKTLQGFGGQTPIWRAAMLLIVAIGAFGLLVDLKNTAKFGQYDLRNRVVGARVMTLGGNPYTYRWHPGEPTTLLDPFIGPSGTISGCTVTPPVLSIHALFAQLHYRYQKFIWLLVQLALFGGIIGLAMSRAENSETRAAVFLAGLMFFCSMFWRMHVERGQVYVLYAFFAALFISSFKWRTANRGILGGLVLGVLVGLQPQMIVLGVPLLIYRQWNYVLGGIGGLVVCLIIPFFISPTVWPDYVHSMMKYVHVPASPVRATVAPAPIAPAFELPGEVEGIQNLGAFAKFGDADTSLKSTLAYLHIPSSRGLFFSLLAAGTLAWFVNVFRWMKRSVPLDLCLARTLGLVLFISLALPIRRGEYSNVILVPLILMIFATVSNLRIIRAWEWMVILAAWILSAPFPPWVSVGFRGADIGVVALYVVCAWTFFAPWKPVKLTAVAADLAVG